MARFITELKDGRKLFAYDFKECEVKVLGDFEIEMIGSTAAVDRDGEILKVDGWDLKNYKKNPVILASHNYYEPAIGRAKNVKLVDGKLVFKIEFPEEGVNPMADIYRKLYKSGFMTASSVGFIPLEWVDGKSDREPRRTFIKQELLELSLVSVPANPQAITTAKSFCAAAEKGIISDAEKEAVLKSLELDQLAEKNGIDRKEIEEMVMLVVRESMKALEEKIEAIDAKIADIKAADDEDHYSKHLFRDDATARHDDEAGEAEHKDSNAPTPKKRDTAKILQSINQAFKGD